MDLSLSAKKAGKVSTVMMCLDVRRESATGGLGEVLSWRVVPLGIVR